MRGFLERHGYDTVLALFGILFGGSVLGLFNEVAAMFQAHPWAVAACCGLSAVAALAISSVADRKAIRVARAEQAGENERLRMRYEREDAERERARAEGERKEAERRADQIDEDLADFANDPSWEKKAMAAVLYGCSGHRAAVDEFAANEIELLERGHDRLGGGYVFFEFDRRGDDYVIVRLAGWLVDLFDERPDVLSDFPKSALDCARNVISRCEP